MISTNVAIVLAAAVVTYLTRAGGHVVLSRFSRVHPRIETALNAVPAAVLTTLVAPAAWHASIPELIALAVAGVVALGGGTMPMFIAGAAVLFALRYLAV